jgi:hypothetical protein
MSDIDDLFEFSDTATDESTTNETFGFFAKRYAAAYGVANLIDIGQWVVAGATVLMMIGMVVLAADGNKPNGGMLCSISVLVLIAAGGYIFMMRAAAALLRVLIDSAVGVAPGLTDKERLKIVKKG